MSTDNKYTCLNCNWTGTDDNIQVECIEEFLDGAYFVDYELSCPNCDSRNIKTNEEDTDA